MFSPRLQDLLEPTNVVKESAQSMIGSFAAGRGRTGLFVQRLSLLEIRLQFGLECQFEPLVDSTGEADLRLHPDVGILIVSESRGDDLSTLFLFIGEFVVETIESQQCLETASRFGDLQY